MIKLLKYKRILAVILLIITILSITQPIFDVSGSGTATWIGGQYYSGIRTTDHSANSNGMLIRRLVNSETGEQITVFCSEHGVDFKPGVRVSGSYYIPTDPNMLATVAGDVGVGTLMAGTPGAAATKLAKLPWSPQTKQLQAPAGTSGRLIFI